MALHRKLAAAALALALAGCGFGIGPAPGAIQLPQVAFWQRLSQLCGRAYQGRMVEGTDSTFVRNRVVIDVRDCSPAEVRIGFVIGPDSSRAWVVSKRPGGLALTHRVSGEGEITGYGGITLSPGTAERQDFFADSVTARMLPPAASNIWSLEIIGGHTLAYTVGRPGGRQRFRLEFDLRQPLSAGS